MFGSAWYFILRWLGIYSVMPSDVTSHFIQFSFLGGAAKSKRSILQVIWYATMWEIWKEITGSSMIRNAQFSRWLTRLSR